MVTGVDADALIDDLDADQRAAVTVPSRLVAVIAGAGSGKTRVLTRRVAHRIATGSADARHTLVLTFTREAAGELRRRLRRLGLTDPVEAGTFHSVMLGVLRQRRADTDRPPVNVLADRRRLLREVLPSVGGRRLDDVLAEFDWAGSRGLTASDYAAAARVARRRPPGGAGAVAEMLKSYQTEKRRRGVVDFDDVLAETLRELRRDDGFADATRWRFRHLHVDEAQDLNPLQHSLIDVLRRGRDDLFLVGDPAQAIYGFNGSDPTLLADVDQHLAGVEVIRLPTNYCCTP
jgi:ATP-dependent DNA helicase UvrD/PcrA